MALISVNWPEIDQESGRLSYLAMDGRVRTAHHPNRSLP